MRPFLCILVALTVIGCKGETGPAGPAGGLVLTGNIQGTVRLYSDVDAYRPLQDASGVSVMLLSQSITTLSQADGSWELTAVPAGIYSFRFSKTGYFSRTSHNFQFVGGGTYYYGGTILSEVPSVTVPQFSMAFDEATMAITFIGAIGSLDTLGREIMILMSTTSMDDTSTFEFDTYNSAYVLTDSINFVSHWYLYPGDELVGTTVYAKAFANARYHWYPSYDPATNRYQFDTPGVSFSPERSIVIP